MRQGLVVFGVILIALGVGMLALSNNMFTKTETGEGPFGIGQDTETQGVSYGIPQWLAWASILGGAVLAVAGVTYDRVGHRAIRTH